MRVNVLRMLRSRLVLVTGAKPGAHSIGIQTSPLRLVCAISQKIKPRDRVPPKAAPKNSSDGKCANLGAREKLIAPARPYITHGTQRCLRSRSSMTVATEKIPAACPEGKLLPLPKRARVP
jgi:hypothetical protein